MDVIEKLQVFEPTEQLLLLMLRQTLLDEEIKYIYELCKDTRIDWAVFLGRAFLNRVNGRIYKRIKEIPSVPKYVKYFLKLAYLEQKERTKYHVSEIQKISELFEKEGIRYSFMKGAVLNTLFYEAGERISNDTDMMVDINNLDKVCTLLKNIGYQQGNIKNGVFIPATKKEILFARLNTYEIVPFAKAIDDRYLPYHEIDINFRLSNDDQSNNVQTMIDGSILMKNHDFFIRTLPLEDFLLFLCIHHYREAIMIFKIVLGDDLTLYKFLDIHVILQQNYNKINWQRFKDKAIKIDRLKDVYFTLYCTEVLFPKTISSELLKSFEPADLSFINEYRGRDNTDEVYTWKSNLANRIFSNSRKSEAMANIKEENDRFNQIQRDLRK